MNVRFRCSIALAFVASGCTLTQSLDELHGSASEIDGSATGASVGVGSGGSWPGLGGADGGSGLGATSGASLDGGAGAAGGSDGGSGGAVGCGAGEKLCGSTCVSLGDQSQGCGSPSCSPCSIAHGSATCASGACAVAACDAGWSDCNGNASDGCEVELATNPDHCGACGKSCFVANASTGCTNGSCYWNCASPFADCDGNLSNGCEHNLNACECYLSCPGCITCCANPATCLQCYC